MRRQRDKDRQIINKEAEIFFKESEARRQMMRRQRDTQTANRAGHRDREIL